MSGSSTANIKKLIDDYKPLNSRENVYKEQMLEFIRSSSNHFNRSNRLGHFTASAFITNKDMSKYLLMHHKKLNKWLQLGGHCDGDNMVARVALKEAKEESGIKNFKMYSQNIFDIDIHMIPKYNDEASHYHFDCRFLLIAEEEKIKGNNESNEVQWFKVNQSTIPGTYISITRMLNKVIDIKRELNKRM